MTCVQVAPLTMFVIETGVSKNKSLKTGLETAALARLTRGRQRQ
jgi:hypothetical protein